VVAQFSLYPGDATAAVTEALVEAAARGVRVRVLLDDEVDANEDAVADLVARGVEARRDEVSTTLHAKMAAADGTLAIVGSTNWSDSAIERNRECNLLLRHGSPPAYIGAWFETVWLDPTDRALPPAEAPGADIIPLVNDRLLSNLLERLNAARESIDFTMYATFLQPNNLDSPAMQVFSAFEDAVARGVSVRGVAEFSRRNNALNIQTAEAVIWLRARGISMRWEDADTVTHEKVVRIDDGIQVGSANFSTSGFSRNQEVGAWTTQPQPVADFSEWFERLWDASTQEQVL
jgi:phosphatidylserine/phosphatidylglycerophosphate/cardiolipin synthase-like enzyme